MPSRSTLPTNENRSSAATPGGFTRFFRLKAKVTEYTDETSCPFGPRLLNARSSECMWRREGRSGIIHAHLLGNDHRRDPQGHDAYVLAEHPRRRRARRKRDRRDDHLARAAA